jgi:hypothetical protein
MAQNDVPHRVCASRVRYKVLALAILAKTKLESDWLIPNTSCLKYFNLNYKTQSRPCFWQSEQINDQTKESMWHLWFKKTNQSTHCCHPVLMMYFYLIHWSLRQKISIPFTFTLSCLFPPFPLHKVSCCPIPGRAGSDGFLKASIWHLSQSCFVHGSKAVIGLLRNQYSLRRNIACCACSVDYDYCMFLCWLKGKLSKQNSLKSVVTSFPAALCCSTCEAWLVITSDWSCWSGSMFYSQHWRINDYLYWMQAPARWPFPLHSAKKHTIQSRTNILTCQGSLPKNENLHSDPPPL